MIGRKKLNKCLSDLVHNIGSEYSGRAIFEFDSGYNTDYGETLDDIRCEQPLSVVVGCAGLYDSEQKQLVALSSSSVSKVVEFVVSTFHECRHVEQFEMMKSVVNKNVQYMSLMHLAAHNNRDYDRNNRSISITEIDAERFAINNAGEFFTDRIKNPKVVDSLLLNYVNNKIANDDQYFIDYPLGKSRYDDVDDVLDAFDAAYDSAIHVHRPYNVLVTNDLAYNFLMNNVVSECRSKCFSELDGLKQLSMISAINLYNHPEYQGLHRSLQYMDLSMEAQFGADWQEQNSLKPKRRLPDVNLSYDGQQSEYEF